jgi:hypothetical protein
LIALSSALQLSLTFVLFHFYQHSRKFLHIAVEVLTKLAARIGSPRAFANEESLTELEICLLKVRSLFSNYLIQ